EKGEALVGNVGKVQQRAASALGLAVGQDERWTPLDAALALVMAGNSAQARGIADDSSKRFPEDTFVQFMYLPTIDAQFALNRGDFSKAKPQRRLN
ncbi:MAG: hypothetical protein WB869_21340, partial [Candidatus Acidiferrales bacterium]